MKFFTGMVVLVAIVGLLAMTMTLTGQQLNSAAEHKLAAERERTTQIMTSENNKTERFEAFLATITALTMGRQAASNGGINIGIGWPVVLIVVMAILVLAWIIGRRVVQ